MKSTVLLVRSMATPPLLCLQPDLIVRGLVWRSLDVRAPKVSTFHLLSRYGLGLVIVVVVLFSN